MNFQKTKCKKDVQNTNKGDAKNERYKTKERTSYKESQRTM